MSLSPQLTDLTSSISAALLAQTTRRGWQYVILRASVDEGHEIMMMMEWW